MVREGASSCCVSVKCRAVVMEGDRKVMFGRRKTKAIKL